MKRLPYDEQRRLLLADLHAAMNGIAAKAITGSGMGYTMAFGVELPRLRQIAAAVEPDLGLSMSLWQEGVRELKMLAIMLMPKELFDTATAMQWLSQLPASQAELCQLMVLDLISQMPDAPTVAFALMAHEDAMHQTAGFLTVSRILAQGATLSPDAEAEYLDQARSLLHSPYAPLARAVSNSLLHYGQTSRQAQHKADSILCN